MHRTPREDAGAPVIVRPWCVWITAAPRPMVAIVPLSWYRNGFGVLARDPGGDVLAGVLAGLQRDRAELRQRPLGAVLR